MSASPAAAGASCGTALLGGVLALLSCSTVTPSAAKCEAACSVANRCGLLPSALGGSAGLSRYDNLDDCVSRCLASDRTNPQVADLLDGLGEAAVPTDEPLCTQEGTIACEELISTLGDGPDTSELEVTTALTVRMSSAVSHISEFSLFSWCCFDFIYELESDPQEMLPPDDLDEVAAVYDMFAPTYQCLMDLVGNVAAATAPVEGQPPTEMGDAAACDLLAKGWQAPAGVEMGSDDDPCYFARSTSYMTRLGIPEVAAACEITALMELRGELAKTLNDWHLETDGILIGPAGDDGLAHVRSLDEVRAALGAEVRDQLTRNGGVLEEACEGYDAAYCETLDRSAPPPSACELGPSCSVADCLVMSPACDPSLCGAELSPPGRDCGLFGVSEVRLGYRTDAGLEILGDPITGCEALAEVQTTFEDIKVGVLVPIAVVSGSLPSFFIPNDAIATQSGQFSWIVEGRARWAAAGTSELTLPSPFLELLENRIENPLEGLGWVPERLPTGQSCDSQPMQCEGFFNDNCDNGYDDDGNGLVDDGDPWCDALYRELVERCVVTPPGLSPPRTCVQDGE